MRLQDFRGLFHHEEVELISIEHIADDYYVAEFKNPESLSWEPGEHAIFTIKGRKIKGKKWRAFSIASRHEEGVIRIGTRIGPDPSAYKAVLRDLAPGNRIDMRGPFGWFKLQDVTSPIVMIAGGIGITPIYGILKELEASDNRRKVEVIVSSKGHYLFKEEIDGIAQEDANITIHYTRSRDEAQAMIKNSSELYGQRGWYYISGTPSMIREVTNQLTSSSIPSKRIINDPFKGYRTQS